MSAKLTPTTAREQVYQQHHRDESAWSLPTLSAADIQIVHTQPPHDPDFDAPPVHRGKFIRGRPDPRRHKFTPEEIDRGYQNALASIDERYPNARCQHNAALSHCFLRHKNPLFFEMRKIRQRQAKLARQQQHN